MANFYKIAYLEVLFIIKNKVIWFVLVIVLSVINRVLATLATEITSFMYVAYSIIVIICFTIYAIPYLYLMRYLSDVTNHFNCKKMIKDIIITIIFYFVFVLVVKPVSFWMLELIPIILSSNKELSLLLLMFIVVFLPAFCIFVSKNDNLTKKEYI